MTKVKRKKMKLHDPRNVSPVVPFLRLSSGAKSLRSGKLPHLHSQVYTHDLSRRGITKTKPVLKPISKTHALPKKENRPKKISLFKATIVKIYKKLFSDTKNVKRVIFFGTIISVSTWLFWGIPLPTNISKSQVPISTKLYDRNGKLIYEIYADRKSTPIKIDELPAYLINATISIEDKDFYKHYGVSITGISRALYKTIVQKKLQGGSTLTQQLVKNSLLTPERTIKRKIREFLLTLVVETIYSKNQILEMYLNQIPYGGTAYGIGAASELYFGKNVKDLTLSEATLLAGLPAAPSLYSPFGVHPEYAKDRQEIVLRRMVEDKYLTQEEADRAKDEKLIYSKPEKLKAPHFALWVKQQLAEKYGESVVEKGGLRVRTTLDLDLQELAEMQVASEVGKLKKQKVGNGAALVTRPSTGEVLALVGSKDYFAEDEDGKVNIIFANRQPGSSIKPINYALALKDKKITPATVLADVPTCFSVYGQKEYCPQNYDGQYRGGVQVRFALGNSLNVPAVRVLALNGLENFVEFAKEMGLTTLQDPKNYGLSLTLGGGEVSPFGMAEAFGVFANQGIQQKLISITKVEDWKGKVIDQVDVEKNELTGARILEPEVTFLISHILYDNNARSMIFGESSYLNVKGHPEVSVKTGTTNDFKDNWTIGYTSYALVVSWVGNNDNTPMKGAISGVSGASPIWNKIMRAVLDKSELGFYSKKDKGHSWPKQPQGVVGAQVCTLTGASPQAEGSDPNCPARFEYFLKDNLPTVVKYGRFDFSFDKTNNSFANESTLPENIEVRQQNAIYDPLGTAICLDCPIPAASQSAKIKYPLTLDNSKSE